MTKQYIANNDKAVRTIAQAFTQGHHGSMYLIADVGKAEGLKKVGVHSNRGPHFSSQTQSCRP